MLVGKCCVFYRDSRCLLKGRFCDLFCDSMKFFDVDGNEDMLEEEETWTRKKDLVWFERVWSASEEETDDT